VTHRTGTAYNGAGLVGGIEERIEETQPDGVKTVTQSNKTPVLYDSLGHLARSHEEATVSTFDGGGDLVRERTRSQDWSDGSYNGLGQLVSSDQTTVTKSLDGAFELTATAKMSGARYDLLGRQDTFTQNETQVGQSVEPLTLPSNWEMLQPDQKLGWLNNLTFVINGETTGFDGLGLSDPDVGGTVVNWSDLSSAERVQLLAAGKTMVNGQQFDLSQATIVAEINTGHEFVQSETQFSAYGAMSHYVRVGQENGVAYTSDWSGNRFDRYNRVTDDTLVSHRAGQAETTTDRYGILYDGNSQVVGFGERVLNGATVGLVTESKVTSEHDALNRQTFSHRVTSQKNKAGEAVELDTVSTQIQEKVSFDEFDRIASYQEIQFGGEKIQLDGGAFEWSELSEHQKNALMDKSLAPTDQVLQIATIAGIVYNEKGLQKGLVENRLSLGEKARR
jgi:hypothetical protein